MPTSSHSPFKTDKKGFADLFQSEVTAWLVLALSLIITVLGWQLSSQVIEKSANDRFLSDARDAQERIKHRVNQYQQFLMAGVAFVDAHSDLSRDHWRVFVSSLDVHREVPGVKGLAFAERVDPAQLSQHESRVRAEGFPSYSVNPSGEREVYFPISLIEPFDEPNQRAFGFDMYSDPVRREAMLRAIDTGKPTVSGLVQLKQIDQTNPTTGFLIYWPVYKKNVDLGSVEARRESVRGFVYSPFVASELMQNVLGNETKSLQFHLYDSQNMSPDSLIYEFSQSDAATEPSENVGYTHEVAFPIELSGRRWMARFQSTPDFDGSVNRALPTLILLAGGVIDVLLFFTIFSLVQQRKRQSASRAKSAFLANMSHEIRTPLNAILGFNTLLGEQTSDPQSKEYIYQIRDASEQLLAMVEDVFSFSQIDAGSIKIDVVEFDLHERVRRVIRLFRGKSIQKGISLELNLDTKTPVIVKGDPARYTQVLSNLLNNAIKFSDSGVVRVSVQVEQQDSQFVVLRTEVQDQGIGFDVKDFDRLTKPFEQADNTITRRFGGSGLGLAISKRLVELMGGKLFVTSVVQAGSVFGFTVQFQAVAIQPSEIAPTVPPAEISLLGKKILVVEDNHLNQHVIKALLTKINAEVQLVENGQTAVEAVANDPSIDLVLMDVHMPVMNGIDATRAIRKLLGPAASVPIVALTAGAFQEDERACLVAGMNGFLTKPVNAIKLRQVLYTQLFPTD